eukprot:jgi/Ulvmu1/9650/UM054_0082.1
MASQTVPESSPPGPSISPGHYSPSPPLHVSSRAPPLPTNALVATPAVEMQPWVRRMMGFLSRVTYGSLRVDLTRPTWQAQRSQRSNKRSQPQGTYNVYGQPVSERVAVMSSMTDNRMMMQQPQGLIHGARVKVMRGTVAGPYVPIPGSDRRAFDAGLGLNIDLAGAGVQPVLRLKLINAVRMYLAPQPIFKLKHTFPIFNTGLCLHAAYVQPLHGTSLRNLGKAGAWNIALGRTGENEIIVSPDRIELSNQRLQLGDSMCLHVSGEVNYPRYLPHPEWADHFSFMPSRVCVKAGW